MTIKSLGQVGTPGNDFDIANKKYVDDASGGPGALEHIRFTNRQIDLGLLNEWVDFAMVRVGTTTISLSQAPIPFDMTIVRMGITLAVDGSDSGIDGNTLFQLWRSPVSGFDEELGAIALQAFLTSVDLEVEIPITTNPGDTYAWRVINNDGSPAVLRYEIHMHYVEQAQLTESQKKYYAHRVKTFKNLDNQNLVRKTKNEWNTRKSLNKLFNAPKSQGDATSTSKDTIWKDTSDQVKNELSNEQIQKDNPELFKKSQSDATSTKKKSKSRYWKR